MVTRRLIGRGIVASFALAVSLSVMSPANAIECVPYARQISGVQISGDAWTWWGQARGEGYTTGVKPQAGSVMVFKRANGMRRGHVAVVRSVVNSREVVVDHANWATRRSGRKGKIDRGVSIIDVSPRNDWSMVRVWYPVVDDYGTSVYPLYGFIYGGGKAPADDGVTISASADGGPIRSITRRPNEVVAAKPELVEASAPATVTLPNAPVGTMNSQLAGATIQFRGGKPMVVGRPVVSAGDPGTPEAAVEPTRRPTERADESRRPGAKRSVVEVDQAPVRFVALKPGASGKVASADTDVHPPVMPKLKPAP